MAIKVDDYRSNEVRDIIASLLFEYGRDINTAKTQKKEKANGRKRGKPDLKVIKPEGYDAGNSDGPGCEEDSPLENAVENSRPAGKNRRQKGHGGQDRPALQVVEPNVYHSQVSIEELIRYYRHKGVIGEEKNCVLQTLCAANSLSFGVEGNSGSGKTFLVNALMELLPEKDVYELGLSSEQAPFNDSRNINKCRFIYIPEIQKAMNNSGKKANSIIELVKNLTEGKDASRIVTVRRGEVAEYRIKAGITIIYTLAFENCFKKDNETSRRFIRLLTDMSDEHIGDVMRHKAEERCSLDEGVRIGKDSIERIRQHIHSCTRMPPLKYFDPFALALSEYIPATPKSIGFVDHYYHLLNASAKFHHKNRIFAEGNLVLDLEDHYLINTLYYGEFCRSLAELNRGASQAGVQDGAERAERIVNGGDDYEAKDEIEWGSFWAEGVKKMRLELPEVADVWVKKQLVEGRIRLYDVQSKGPRDIIVEARCG